MLKIREYRKQRKLTIKELAALSGMSISYISQVERGEIDPSLSSLRKFAAIFEVPLYMILDDMDAVENLTLRKEQQLVSYSEDKKISYRFLTPLPSPRYSPEALLIGFEVAAHSQDVQEPVRHHSEEYIYVTEGQLTVQIGDTDIVLEAGDATVVQKDLPHICKNVTDTVVKGISAISPPVWGRMDLTAGD
ncbi:MAG: helix-turn-helix domain-containing protein [Lachnospiraceae bacterium]|nr:helix-turn-helix domain-containing protein [Lachnospiraceae bacterium]